MAWEIPGFTFTRVAGEDLSADQYRFVQLGTGDNVNDITAITQIACGVLQNKPTSGKEATIMVNGVSKLSAGDNSISIGSLLGTANDGQAVAIVAGTDTTQYIFGIGLEASAAADDIVAGLVSCFAPARAA